MRVKIANCVVAFILAATCCLAPYARAYAVAIPAAVYAGRALAAVLATYGLCITLSSDDDAAALWSDWELYTDDLDAMAQSVGQLQDAAIATGSLTNATKSQVSQEQIDAIDGVFAAAGEAGTFALDQLMTMNKDGAFNLLPFLLSLFIAGQVTGGEASSYLVSGVPVNVAVAPPFGKTSNSLCFYESNVYETKNGVTYGPLIRLYWSDSNCFFTFSQSSDGAISFKSSKLISCSYYYLDGTSADADLGIKSSSAFPSIMLDSDFTLISTFNRAVKFGMSSSTYTLVFQSGAFSGDLDLVTDNPDVNLGHDYWDDAKSNVDALNPATGAAVIGADAVIDGDYVRNRGSIAIPTDYSNINSWADALGATHAGVVEGALDGTISTTQTGTAVDTATGELVTDTVGELVKPNGNTSVSPNTNFDWSKFLDPSLYLVFPFCLPWDLVELVKTLSAEPQAPVIEWYMPTLGGGETLRFDLSPWSPVAAVLRAGELVVAAVGLIWITKTMIRV